jgi:hypothetical protein
MPSKHSPPQRFEQSVSVGGFLFMEDTTTEVTETTETVAEETSTPVESTDTPEQGDPWETPLAFPTEDKEQVSAETATPEVNEETKTETTEEVKEEAKTEAEAETDAEEEADPEVLDAAADKPAPLSRRKLREVEEKFITPLRDPDAPIENVWNGLRELNPQRANDLAQMLINQSAEKYADQWIEVLTGIEGATVETVKQKFSGEPNQPDTFKTVAERFDELYGDAWRDPAQDEDLLDDDRIVVQALRDHLKAGTQVSTEKDVEIAKLKDQLDKLQPEIENIKTQQEAEFERFVIETKQKSQDEYQQAVMSRVVPKLLDEHGLKVSDNDAEIVKLAKEELAEKFKQSDGDMSDFEYFALRKFSGKDDLIKKIGRVEKYFDLAAKAEADAKRAKDAQKRSELLQSAEAYRADAKQEQDSFVVMSRKAGKEFLEKSSVMRLIEENAHLQTQLSQANFRPEVIANAAVAGATSIRDRVMQSDDPWGENSPSLSEVLR